MFRQPAKYTVGALLEPFSDSFSRRSGEGFSSAPHPPKLEHIGQTVNARGFTYDTRYDLHILVARQGKGRGFGIVYCRRTTGKAPDANIGDLAFMWDLQEK